MLNECLATRTVAIDSRERSSRIAVWLYFRFGVSFRDVEEAMAARGVLVSYETVRRWCDKFGHLYAAGLRRRRARTGDKWHLDEVFLKINGVQALSLASGRSERRRHRYSRATKARSVRRHALLPQAVAGHRPRRPRVIMTDKLRSYAAAKRVVMPGVAHRQHRYLNNRAENSHQPTRERERRMRRFKSARARATLCRGARNHRLAFPTTTPPALRC